jgi:pilus assembly protein FimV
LLPIVLIDDDSQSLLVDSDTDRLPISLFVRVRPLVIVTKPVDADADRMPTAVLKLTMVLEADVEIVVSVSDNAATFSTPVVDRSSRRLLFESSTVDSETAPLAAADATSEMLLFAAEMPVESDVMLVDNDDSSAATDSTPLESDVDSVLRSLLVDARPVDSDPRSVALAVDRLVTFDAIDENAVDADVDSELCAVDTLATFVDADVLIESIPVDTDAILADDDSDSDVTPSARVDRLGVRLVSSESRLVISALVASSVDSDRMRSDDAVVLMLDLTRPRPVDTEPLTLATLVLNDVMLEAVDVDNVRRLTFVVLNAVDVEFDNDKIELLVLTKRSDVEMDSDSNVSAATLMLVDRAIRPVDAEPDSAPIELLVLDRPVDAEIDSEARSTPIVDRLVVAESRPSDTDVVSPGRLLFVVERLVLSAAIDVEADDDSDETALFPVEMPVLIEMKLVDAEVERVVRFAASVLPEVEIEAMPGSSELTMVLNCATVATSCGSEPSATLVNRRRLLALPIDTSPLADVLVP